MKNATRELLLITHATRHWDDHFNEQVNALMQIVGEVDNEEKLGEATEVIDVYQHSLSTASQRLHAVKERPFAFTAFRN